LESGSEINTATLNATGNCGEYIELRAQCDETLLLTGICVNVLPVLNVTSSITSADYLKLSNLKTIGVAFTATNSFDEGGNIGWTITEPAASSTLYWIGNTGNWNDKGNWSASSGGAPDACIPSEKTHVVFDNNSFVADDTVKLFDYGYCASMTWTALPPNIVFKGDGNLFVSDSIVLHSNLSADFNGNLYLENSEAYDTITITSNGAEINAIVFIEGTQLWDFVDPAVINNDFNFINGRLKFSGGSVDIDNFVSTSSNTRTIDLSGSTLNLNGENIIWDVSDANLSFDYINSEIRISNLSSNIKEFKGAGLTYNDIVCESDYVKIWGNNVVSRLELFAGNSLILEEGNSLTVDSLDAVASCVDPISIVSTDFNNPAVLQKIGHDTLTINNFYLKNIQADTVGGKLFEANQTMRSGNVDGWIFNDTITGKTFVWQGVNGNWHDLLNWKVGGLAATCLPTIVDTVVVDPVIFAAATSDIMQIDKNAYCHSFTATGLTKLMKIEMSQNLNISESLMLCDSVRTRYSVVPDIETTEGYDYGFVLMPDSTSFTFSPSGAEIGVSIYANSSYHADTITLITDLQMDTVASLNVMSGCFLAQNKTISCGNLITSSDADKTINIEKSNINIIKNLEFQNPAILTFLADSSTITYYGNETDFSFLSGNGQTFFDVKIFGNTDADENDEIVFVLGSNNYNILSVFDGTRLFAEEGETQTVDNALIIKGTCQNYVTICSSVDGLTTSFNNNSSVADTVICVNIKDVENLAGAVAMLSVDDGNNSGWNFNSQMAVTSNFVIPDTTCISSDLVFDNNSITMFGDSANLIYEWIFNNDTTYVENLNYTFDLQGDYQISLMATDTTTGCSDVFIDTLKIEQQTAFVTSSVPGLTICDGNNVTFTATSDLATEFEFYLNNIWVDLGNPAETEYSTSILNDGDIIRVDAIYKGCIESSNDLAFTVNSSPVAVLSCSDVDTIICAGDSITFYTSALDTLSYEFFINGNSLGSFSADSVYSTDMLSDQDTITARAMSQAGCIAMLPYEYIVTVLPNPVVNLTSLPDPPTICDGEQITFNASGTTLYGFVVNGIGITDTITQDFYQSSTLVNNDIITCYGIDVNGCSSISNSIDLTVNPSPIPDFTSSDSDDTICTGDEVIFTATGADEYQYYIDGVSQGLFDPSQTLTTTTLTHNQTISLEGRIGTCTEMSATTLTFNVYPVIELTSSINTICPGDNITFTATGDTVYQFQVDGIPVTPLEANNVFNISTLTDGQRVSVVGTPGACLPQEILVTVNPLPVANVTCSESDTAICAGDELSFIASGATEYEFFVDGVSQGIPSSFSNFSSNSINDGQEVTVIATSEFGCVASALDTFNVTVYDYPTVSLTSSVSDTQICEGESLLFTASGADEYQFMLSGFPLGDYSAVTDYYTSDLGNAQVVSVSGQSNGCVFTAPETYSYTVFSLPNASLTALTPLSVCEADEISVQANGAVEYEFFVNSVSQGVQSAVDVYTSTTLSDGDYITLIGYQNICSNPCTDTIVVNVNQVPMPVFTSNVSADGICYGDTAEFYVSGAMLWQFYLDGSEYGEMTSENMIQIPWLEEDQTVNVVGYNNACFAQADTTMTPYVNYVNAQLIVDPEQSTVCDGDIITLSATGGDLYEFFVNDISEGDPLATNTHVLSSVTNNDYVSVAVTDIESGCTVATGNYTFNVLGIPQITVDPELNFCQFDSIMLNSNYNTSNQWYFNDVEIPDAVESTYAVYEPGVYSVNYISGFDGGVSSCGANALGQLGTGDNVQSDVSVQTMIDDEIVKVSAGEEFAVGLSEEGSIYAWGDNAWGNIGNGTYSPVYDPILLQSVSNAKQVAAGNNHVLAIASDNTLISWGRNTYGQLGYGSYASSNFPMPVAVASNIVAVAAGRNHSLALTADGDIYAWGANDYGQLGTGDFVEQNQPIIISGLHNVIGIAAGADFSMAVLDDGTVWTWGCNDNGQLGHNNINSSNVPVKVHNLHKIVMVSGGNSHALALNERGEVFSWGANSEGQLGIGNTNQSLVFKRVEIKGVKKIEAGSFNSFAVKNDGSVWSWGLNNFAQLGDQTIVNQILPVSATQFQGVSDLSAGKNFVCVVREESKSCKSDVVTLTMDSVPEVVITRSGMNLSTIEGESYQWYFNSSPIGNSNSQTISITAEGEYSVEVFFANGCSAMSDIYSFYLDIDEWFVEQNATIFPNPNRGSFELLLNMPETVMSKIDSWTLSTVSGAIIAVDNDFLASDKQRLEFNGIAPGAYYLTIQSSVGVFNIKVFITQ